MGLQEVDMVKLRRRKELAENKKLKLEQGLCSYYRNCHEPLVAVAGAELCVQHQAFRDKNLRELLERRKARKVAGLCRNFRCRNKVDSGSTACSWCKKKNAIRSNENYDRKKEHKLCTWTGCLESALRGFSTCAVHREQIMLKSKRARNKKKEKRLRGFCSKLKCFELLNGDKYYCPVHTREERAKKLAKYQEKYLDGLCRNKGCYNPRHLDRVSCMPCMIKYAERTRQLRARVRARTRAMASNAT